MSAHVVLNLSNEWGKEINCETADIFIAFLQRD